MSNAGTLTISVRDFWRGFKPSSDPVVAAVDLATRSSGLTLRDGDEPSLVIFSVYGQTHALARGTKLAVSGEARCATDREAHWWIDSRWRPLENHFRLPQWAYAALTDDVPFVPSEIPAHRFCNFIYSNPRCGMRNAFFEMLGRRQPVDALGSVGRNADHPALGPRASSDWSATKRSVLRDYRFTIAFENEELPGYTTEKMIDAWLADSVPIYWGNPAYAADFPPGSCLSLYESGTLHRLVEDVLEAHHEPERYAQLQAANPFRTGHAQVLLERMRVQLDEFAVRVVDDARAQAGQRRLSRDAELRARGAQLRRGTSKALRRLL